MWEGLGIKILRRTIKSLMLALWVMAQKMETKLPLEVN